MVTIPNRRSFCSVAAHRRRSMLVGEPICGSDELGADPLDLAFDQLDPALGGADLQDSDGLGEAAGRGGRRGGRRHGGS
jgi:hypothetical protein